MRSFSEIRKAPLFELSFFELFIMFIYVSLMLLALDFGFSFLIFVVVDLREAIVVFLSFLSFCVINSLYFLFFKFLNNHFQMVSINSKKLSFEGLMVQNLFVGVGFWLFFMNLGLFHGHFFNGCGLGFGYLFASWVTFLRKDSVFNEDSLVGVESDGEVIGYNPLYYCFLSLVCGIVLFYIAFMGLGHFIDFGFDYLVPCVIKLVVAFVVMTLIISPDVTSRYVPWDIRTKSGFNKYGVLCAFISVVVGVLLVHFLGG